MGSSGLTGTALVHFSLERAAGALERGDVHRMSTSSEIPQREARRDLRGRHCAMDSTDGQRLSSSCPPQGVMRRWSLAPVSSVCTKKNEQQRTGRCCSSSFFARTGLAVRAGAPAPPQRRHPYSTALLLEAQEISRCPSPPTGGQSPSGSIRWTTCCRGTSPRCTPRR